MSRIRILPDRVANQIAAGEVVERPVAVVKELLENSLDAGADRLEVEFRLGGRKLIRVEDNGSGMTPDEALLALERHATSKIREAVDLNSVRSFGFRGEALPSIASVSRFTLRTRPADRAEGCEVKVNGGKLVNQRACGMPPGTQVEVEDLFYPVPARRKFLKTDQTEAAHILQLLRWLAVAHPERAFTLMENGRILLQSPPCESLRERVEEIWGKSLAENLEDFAFENDVIRLHGLLGKPGFSRSSRHEMLCLVNRRPVESRTLNYAIIEAYHTAIPRGRYPVVFLHLEIDPALVDVNVHPTKREIRFREESRVRHWVISALLDHLRSSGQPKEQPPPGEPDPAAADAPAASPGAGPLAAPDPPPTPGAGQGAGKTLMPPAPVARAVGREQAVPVPAPDRTPSGREGADHPVAAPGASPMGRNWRYVGRMVQGWILFETGAGLLLLDPAAAQARIRFEAVRDHFKANRRNSQSLLLPVSLQLEPVAASCLEESMDYLNRNGFAIEPFGRNFFRVLALPPWLDPGEAEAYLRDLVEAVRQRGLKLDLEQPELADQAMARLAVDRNRGRPGGGLDSAEGCLQLARSLLECRDPHTDPAGRATMVEWSRREIDQRFGRGGPARQRG